MRVLYLSTGNLPSRWAHTLQIAKMAEAIAAQGDDCELVTVRGLLPGPLERVDVRAWYGVGGRLRVTRLPVRLRFPEASLSNHSQPRYEAIACGYARWRRPDLVYSRSLGAALRCVRAGLPTLLESHLSGDAPELAQVREVAGCPALRGLVTVTEALRQDWIAVGLPAEKIRVWPDAVALERFAEPMRLEAARARLALEAGPLVVYCGHFYPEKGVETLVAAAPQLRKARVLLVGGWPEDVERMRARASRSANVALAGYVPNAEVPAHLWAADVLVLPNSGRHPQARTTSPLKLFEYMAARRPIVASRIPALAGLLEHGRNAWLVTPDQPEALAEGIERVLADPELGARLAEQAARDVAHYTWKRRAAELLAPERAARSA
jgi:glycosyltransferase involved in cell wall biosynthesis